MIKVKCLSSLLLLLTVNLLSAQENKIVNLLNKELNKEVKIQLKHLDFLGDTITVIKPFSIDDKILSITIKKPLATGNGYLIEKQEVALDKIKSFGKDITIFFETESEAVRITQTKVYRNNKQEIYTSTSHLLLTPIHLQKNNKQLGDTIKKAFEKSGYSIDVNYWLD